MDDHSITCSMSRSGKLRASKDARADGFACIKRFYNAKLLIHSGLSLFCLRFVLASVVGKADNRMELTEVDNQLISNSSCSTPKNQSVSALKDMSQNMTKSYRISPLSVSLIFFVVVVVAIGGLDVFLRSQNDATDEDRALGVSTRMGDYRSFSSIGMLPLSLVLALNKWPDRASCLADQEASILRWKDFGSTTEAEVCLSRVFTKTRTDDEIVAILAANGFAGAMVRTVRSPVNSAKTRVSASCLIRTPYCGVTLQNFWHFPFEIYSSSVEIFRDGSTTLNIKVHKIAK